MSAAELPNNWRRAAALSPLLYGDYGFGLDMLGITIEQLSKQSLDNICSQCFTPLGNDRHRILESEDKPHRYAKPVPVDSRHRQAASAQPRMTQPLKFECGGAARPSTASDHSEFAMIAENGGRSAKRECRPQDRELHVYDSSDRKISKNLIGMPIRPAPI